LIVGRFLFSKKAFDKAVKIIRDDVHKEGWLVIDEIGPLELGGGGFCDILKEVLSLRPEKLLLVVRDKNEMVEKVKEYFGLTGAEVIKTVSALI
jgi:nucleoside-triphosphatase THEP1